MGKPGPSFNRPLSRDCEEVARLTVAARSVLARGGWWGFKVDSVLRTAGLSTRCFYRHFETKDHLLLHLLQEDVARGSRRLERLCVQACPEARIRAWCDGMLDMAYLPRIAKPTAVLTVHWHQLTASFPAEVDACRTLLTRPLVAAVADLDPDLDPEASAYALFHLVAGPTAEVISRGGSPDRATLERQLLPMVDRLLTPAVQRLRERQIA
ncbi:MAG: TetR/AcrR family transcriptional regulator [Mycobacteriales bacterium]